MKFELKGLYFITDRSLSRKSVVEDVKAAIRGGVRIVQYREKNLDDDAMIAEAKQLAEICRNRALFIVNDRVQVALASNADGMHIGPYDTDFLEVRKALGGEKIIGVTVSSAEDAKRFERLGADYVSLSPVFVTSTKKDAGEPIGIEVISEAKKRLRIPFTVIGGINLGNLENILDAGAESVCMMSAIIAKDDVEKEVRKVEMIIHEHAARKGKEQ
jgi:thiamine-phosphate pyrophosphorylase